MSKVNGKKKVAPSTHLIAGGIAGFAEACTCHPLDTIKVRMQLSRRTRASGQIPRGFFATGASIVKRETPLGLYKGLGAVITGIVPKMACRFLSFEQYKGFLADKNTGITSPQNIFLAGLGAGATEAVVVVNPMEVVKIRLQAQYHSLADPLEIPRYRNAAHALYTIVKEEGVSTLYRGVALTAARQATNQAANFTAYQQLKAWAQKNQGITELPNWQTMMIGLISGALGPFTNAPIDTIKTRIQKASKVEGETALSRVVKVAGDMFRQEGPAAFWKGITPRVARVAPGQSVVFLVYEKIRDAIEAAKAGEFNLTDTLSDE
ncbi:mitochondrial carrier [Tilletiaria anomala UBC 951]|uniref:Mitochondrial carrier n=1 Tax=Tilletiaria anomala (strain ATCC 24038 / CBS 436.72 / UBC 951) TaxID=1037660 RepID=A0A066VDM8_TILAU|nr:mitochondrial carrier [Tilletiaria anomala UBC 951]KDN38388.1 mitochondrial carrier [Tilletiaria anomala UBC 951]